MGGKVPGITCTFSTVQSLPHQVLQPSPGRDCYVVRSQRWLWFNIQTDSVHFSIHARPEPQRKAHYTPDAVTPPDWLSVLVTANHVSQQPDSIRACS